MVTSPLDWALAYAAHGLPIFPCAANKAPLTRHGFKDATIDIETNESWWAKWPFADPAWALPTSVVVVDLDTKHGKNGLRDFERLAGCNPRDAVTPIASTPSGGLHVFYDAGANTYRNCVAIEGTGIDARTEGGSVILPAHGNGREWIRSLHDTPMLRAPAWLDVALRRPPVDLFLRPWPAPLTPHGCNLALRVLARALALIIAARRGARDDTRHRQCFAIGALIRDGALDYEIARTALCAAAREMEGASDWPDLDARVEYSIKRGMEQGQ
jgi:hypothetical protein